MHISCAISTGNSNSGMDLWAMFKFIEQDPAVGPTEALWIVLKGHYSDCCVDCAALLIHGHKVGLCLAHMEAMFVA